MPVGAIGAVAGIAGGLMQGSAAKKAARSQERMAQQDIAFQTETRDLIRNDLSPYRNGGPLAQQAIDYELGLGPRPMVGGTPMAIETIMPGVTGGQTAGQFAGQAPAQPARPTLSAGQRASRFMDSFGRADRDGTGPANGSGMGGSIDSRPISQPMAGGTGAGAPMYRVGGQTFSTMEEAQAFANANATGGTPYGGFTKTPGYDFRLQTGMDALQSTAAARGGLYSGAAMRDALKFGQDYGTNEYGNYLARLGARADTGMAAAAGSGQASQAAAGAVSNAFGNIGNARAAGAIGMGNAFTGGIQNALGAWNYQRNLNAATPGGNTFGMFGGGR